MLSNDTLFLDDLDLLLNDGIEMPMDNDGHDSEMLQALGTLVEGNPTGFIHFYLSYFISDIGYRPHECLRLAYTKISKRSGVMKNGKFVKSADL